jgi:hippurate hydrolase
LALQRSVERIAKSIGQLHGATVEFQLGAGTPQLINPPEGTALARQAARSVIEPVKVTRLEMASMGGEDFSYYLESTPGCFVRFGTARDGVPQFPAHSGSFNIDEEALAVGTAWFHAVAVVAGQAIRARGA